MPSKSSISHFTAHHPLPSAIARWLWILIIDFNYSTISSSTHRLQFKQSRVHAIAGSYPTLAKVIDDLLAILGVSNLGDWENRPDFLPL